MINDSIDGKSKRKFKHFTLNKRKKLLEFVKEGYLQNTVAEQLDMSPTSISRELKRNRSLTRAHAVRNVCKNIQNCTVKALCANMNCNTLCKNCRQPSETAVEDMIPGQGKT